MVVGVCAFASGLRGLKLIPAKWRYLVPPRRIEPVEITSGYLSPLTGTFGRVLRKRKPLKLSKKSLFKNYF